MHNFIDYCETDHFDRFDCIEAVQNDVIGFILEYAQNAIWSMPDGYLQDLFATELTASL